jgi:hypothetical protein
VNARSDGLPPQNATVAPRELHMEVMDPRSFDVWLHQQPVTLEEYTAFTPEPPYVKSGAARAAMDYAWFLRSPGASSDGALETRSIGGREFARVARPLNFRGLAQGDAPTRLEIDKHHLLGFNAGSPIRFVRLPDGDWYIQQTRGREDQASPLPADWALRTLLPPADWSVRLPSPATVWFFRNFDSYVGPIDRAVMPA